MNKRQYLPSKRLLSSEGVEGGDRAQGVRAAEKGGDAQAKILEDKWEFGRGSQDGKE